MTSYKENYRQYQIRITISEDPTMWAANASFSKLSTHSTLPEINSITLDFSRLDGALNGLFYIQEQARKKIDDVYKSLNFESPPHTQDELNHLFAEWELKGEGFYKIRNEPVYAVVVAIEENSEQMMTLIADGGVQEYGDHKERRNTGDSFTYVRNSAFGAIGIWVLIGQSER